MRAKRCSYPIALVLLFACALMAICWPEAVPAEAAGGRCGEALRWALNEAGRLTISGSGRMTDFANGEAVPWAMYRDRISAVEIESGATSVGDYAFHGCDLLEEATLPEGLSKIGQSAFGGCKMLTGVVIPESVTGIYSQAFCENEALQSIRIPEGVKAIPGSAFRGCTGLRRVEMTTGLKSIFGCAFEGCTGLETIVIPDSVSYVGERVFLNCGSLRSVLLPEGIGEIRAGLFEGCEGLLALNVPESVTFIGTHAFLGCRSLGEIILPGGLKSVSYHAFSGCHGLGTVKYRGAWEQRAGIRIERGNEDLEESEWRCYPASLTLSGEAEMDSAESQVLGVTVTPENAYVDRIVWTSSDCSVAMVEEGGKVTAGAAGSASITAQIGAISQSFAVTVRYKERTGFELPESGVLYIGETRKIEVRPLPAGAEPPVLTWSSTDEGVATVDGEGRVTALAVGNTTIVARSSEDDMEERLIIEVQIPALTGLVIEGEGTMPYEGRQILTVRPVPAAALVPELNWSSSNEAVAKVAANGSVTALSDGRVTITATAPDGIRADFVITVALPLEKIALLGTAEMQVGTEQQLILETHPEGVSLDPSRLAFASSAPAVASVDQAGRVKALSEGRTFISVAAFGRVWDDLEVGVTRPPLTGIELKGNAGMDAGDSQALELRCAPEHALLPPCSWYSSNEAVAVVDGAGLVTALREGETVIRVTAGEFSGQFPITVRKPLEAALCDTILLQKGKTIKLPVLRNASVTWSSSDPGVAKVIKNTYVKAVANGDAVLTLTIVKATGKGVMVDGSRMYPGEHCTIDVLVRGKAEIARKVAIKSGKKMNLHPGIPGQEQGRIEAVPLGGSDIEKRLFYVSSRPDVLWVDQDGTVTARKPGKAKVTVYTPSQRSASVTVTVRGLVTKIRLHDEQGNRLKALKLSVGDQYTLYPRVNEDALDKSIHWKSSNSKVASVDEAGTITAHKKGKAKITAIARDDSKKKAAVTVTVRGRP